MTHLSQRRTRRLRSACAALLAAALTATLAPSAASAQPAPARPGAAATAVVAAAAPAPTVPETGPRGAVGCVDDGSSGKRVQVLYVRDPNTPDQFDRRKSALLTYLRSVDDVFVQSARVNGGGYRQVRWVHDSNCQPDIQRLVIPPVTDVFGTHIVHGTIGDTIAALRAAKVPLDNLARKFVVLVEYPGDIYSDPNCGIAWGLYREDTSPLGSSNRNNQGGSVARVDSQCFAGTVDPDSYAYTNAIAHELTHTLGAVTRAAPHATESGHCTDNSDIMCYRDASSGPMTKSCEVWHENILDCGGDDYFNTNPPAGSWLATHWNVANSSFLYQPDPPAARAPTLATGAAFVPGLPASFSAVPNVPSGQGWQQSYLVTPVMAGPGGPATCVVGRTSALSGQPDGTTLPVLCPATTTRVLTSAKVTQFDGRTSQSGGLSYAPTQPRPAGLNLTSSVTSAPATGAQTTLRVTVTDEATGQGVYGVPVRLSATTASGTKSLGTVYTDQTGVASSTATVSATTTYRAWADAADQSVYLTNLSEQTVRVPAATQLSLDAPTGQVVSPGSVVALTGRLTGAGAGVPGMPVTVWRTTAAGTAQMATASTDGAGTFRANVTVDVDATYQARFAGGPDYLSSSSGSVSLSTDKMTTTTLALSSDEVDPGAAVTISGQVRSNGAAVAGRGVTLWFGPDSSTLAQVAGATTAADGSASFRHVPTGSGTYQLRFAASGPYQASSSATVPVSVRQAVTVTPTVRTPADPTRGSYGATLTIEAAVTAGSVPVPGVPVQLWRTAPGPESLVATGDVSDATGRASVSIASMSDATYQVRTPAVSGWAASASAPVAVKVVSDTQLTAALSSSSPANGAKISVSGLLDAAAMGALVPNVGKSVELWGATAGATPTRLATTTTGAGGTYSFSVTATASSTYQVRHPADANTNASESQSLATRVPTLVSAAAPTFVNDVGVISGKYTLPTRTGVQYLVGGVVKAAGTYPAGASVTVTARAASGYQLTGTASWAKTFVMISPFADVATNRWGFTQINYLWRTGVAPGSVVSGKRYFSPAASISREQFALHAYRLAGSPAYTPPRTSPFADVSTRSASYKAITWFYAKGASSSWVVSRKRYFKPSLAVTRGMMAFHLYKLAGSPYYAAPRTSPFADMTPKSAYYKETAWAYSKGELTTWVVNRRRYVKPTTNLLRDQMAVGMYVAKTSRLLR